MRTTVYVIVVVAAAALLVAGCSRQPELTPAQIEQVKAELEQTLREAYDLKKPSPVERMMSLYPTSRRVVSANTGRAFTSRDSIGAGVQAFWQHVGVNMKDPTWAWGDMYLDVLSPTSAVVTATYSVPHRNPNNQPHVLHGAMTLVFQKQGTKWVVIQEHLSDAPATGGSPAMSHDHH